MKATKGQLRSGFTLVELLVVISIIVVLAGLAVPTAMKALGKAEEVKGISNVKGIKSALELFASDYDGEYPSDDTAAELLELSDDSVGGANSKRGSGLKSGGLQRGRVGDRGRASDRNTGSNQPSNFYYEQLIVGNALDNEELFFQKTFKKAFRVKQPDSNGKIDPRECVWGYTKGLQQTSDSHIPIVFDAPASTGDAPKFSKKVWAGKVIVARLDNSTRPEKIGGTGKDVGYVTGRVDGERVNLFAPESLGEGILVAPDLKRIGSDR